MDISGFTSPLAASAEMAGIVCALGPTPFFSALAPARHGRLRLDFTNGGAAFSVPPSKLVVTIAFPGGEKPTDLTDRVKDIHLTLYTNDPDRISAKVEAHPEAKVPDFRVTFVKKFTWQQGETISLLADNIEGNGLPGVFTIQLYLGWKGTQTPVNIGGCKLYPGWQHTCLQARERDGLDALLGVMTASNRAEVLYLKCAAQLYRSADGTAFTPIASVPDDAELYLPGFLRQHGKTLYLGQWKHAGLSLCSSTDGVSWTASTCFAPGTDRAADFADAAAVVYDNALRIFAAIPGRNVIRQYDLQAGALTPAAKDLPAPQADLVDACLCGDTLYLLYRAVSDHKSRYHLFKKGPGESDFTELSGLPVYLDPAHHLHLCASSGCLWIAFEPGDGRQTGGGVVWRCQDGEWTPLATQPARMSMDGGCAYAGFFGQLFSFQAKISADDTCRTLFLI